MHPNNKTDRLREQLLTEGVIWKQLVLFSIPIMVGTLFQQLYNMIDAIVVGNFVGITALAAVGGSTQQIIGLILGFFLEVSAGAAVLIAQYYGGTFLDRIFSGTCFFTLDEYTGRHDAGSCPIFENLFLRDYFFTLL